MSFGSFMMRTLSKLNDKNRKHLVVPSSITEWTDILYGEDKKNNLLDVYKPVDKKDEKIPFIISVHGGGWVYGDKQGYKGYCLSLVKYGFAVINFTYTLSPKVRFPNHIKETLMVIKWAMDNSDKYGLDLDNCFLIGDSAGGNIVSIISALMSNEEYSNKMGIKVPEGFKVKCLGLNCGLYKETMSHINTLSHFLKFMEKGMLKDYLGKKNMDKMYLSCPYDFINSSTKPAYILTAKGDFLKANGIMMDEKYTELKIPHEFKIYGSEEEPLQHVFFLNPDCKEGLRAMDDEMKYFKTFIS